MLAQSMAPPLRANSRDNGTVMDWTRILAYVTGTVDQELLARNEYLAAENRILKSQLNGRLRLHLLPLPLIQTCFQHSTVVVR
jgi:hypothetical protein